MGGRHRQQFSINTIDFFRRRLFKLIPWAIITALITLLLGRCKRCYSDADDDG